MVVHERGLDHLSLTTGKSALFKCTPTLCLVLSARFGRASRAVCWFFVSNLRRLNMTTSCKPPVEPAETDEYELVFVKSFWHKRAKRRITAAELGLKAIPLRFRRQHTA